MERAKRAQQIIAAIQLLAIYIRIQRGPNISRQWKMQIKEKAPAKIIC
jgi:hypothetical protein